MAQVQMGDPKKVIILGTAHPLRGGLAAFNERLAREYLSTGCDVEIYTFTLQYPSFLFPGKTQFSDEPAPADLRIRVRVNSVNPFNWIKTGREIRKKKPDLLIVKFWLPFMAPCFGTIARIVRRNRHTRIISIVDNMIPHEKRVGDKALSNYWAKSVDGFIAMSKSVLADIRLFSQKPAAFCPHPIYDIYGESHPKEKAKELLKLDKHSSYILFFGFIRDYKGLDLLIRAFAEFAPAIPSVKLLVAGEFYTDSKPYLSLIHELNLEDRVVLATSFIPDSEVGRYFCAGDIVVQPYKSATQSGVTQIAYHFNKPMIITRVGGLEEFVKDNVVGYAVEPDPAAIASALSRFYSEGKEAEFSLNAGIEKQRFLWSSMTRAIDELYL